MIACRGLSDDGLKMLIRSESVTSSSESASYNPVIGPLLYRKTHANFNSDTRIYGGGRLRKYVSWP